MSGSYPGCLYISSTTAICEETLLLFILKIPATTKYDPFLPRKLPLEN